MRADITPGATFPDYELPDHDGVSRRLSEIQGDDPMIVVLSRGRFCPKDHQQHLELVELKPRIDVAYTKIVTISTDDLVEAGEMRRETGADWPFLSDPERIIQKDLEIREANPYHDPMVPHTLVLGPGLEVYSIYVGYYFWAARHATSSGTTCGRSSSRPGPILIRRSRSTPEASRVTA